MSEPAPWTIAFSSCPNDTFMFDALLHRRGRVQDFDYPPLQTRIQDIAELNHAMLMDPDPPWLTKCSVAALARSDGRYRALRSGAALGYGVGPLLLAREGQSGVHRAGHSEGLDKSDKVHPLDFLRGASVAIPGELTTATLLLRIFAPADLQLRSYRFDQIMPAIASGEVDAGVVIHESRFTYTKLGLSKLADLGELWEQKTGLPLALGLIAARSDAPREAMSALEAALGASIEHAQQHPEHSREFVRKHAQEMDPAVCAAHIALYVNEFSTDLNTARNGEGIRAVEALIRTGRECGALPSAKHPLWWGD